MKIELPNPEHFTFKDCVIGGDECWLINPKDIKTKWSDDNLHFRSLIIRKSDHFVVSTGFKKFFNLTEQPDIDKFPDGSFTAYEKHDGSLIICTWHYGEEEEFVFRTRGTSSITSLDNGYELQFLLEKYPKLKVAMRHNPLHSILCEWETPNNKIVLDRVDEPTLTLIGVVRHEDFSYVPQEELDRLAIAWGLGRPEKYDYSSIAECVKDVHNWKGKEGVVLYSEDGQHLRKIKGEEYLNLHKILFGFKTIKSYLDCFMETERFAKYGDFFNYVESHINYEVAERGKDDIRKICVAYSKVVNQIDNVKKHVDQLKNGFSRKEQAVNFQQHWKDWRLSAAFQYLDDGKIDDKIIRRGIEKELES